MNSGRPRGSYSYGVLSASQGPRAHGSHGQGRGDRPELADVGRRTHRLVGLTRYRHRDFGLADLLHGGDRWGPGIGIGSVETEALPAGP